MLVYGRADGMPNVHWAMVVCALLSSFIPHICRLIMYETFDNSNRSVPGASERVSIVLSCSAPINRNGPLVAQTPALPTPRCKKREMRPLMEVMEVKWMTRRDETSSEKSRRYTILGRDCDAEEPDEGECALIIDSKKCLSSDWLAGAFRDDDDEAGANGLLAPRGTRTLRTGSATADTLPNVTL